MNGIYQSLNCIITNITFIYFHLQNNLQRMDYKTYLENGYLIGSGAIEVAQRTVEIKTFWTEVDIRWRTASIKFKN